MTKDEENLVIKFMLLDIWYRRADNVLEELIGSLKKAGTALEDLKDGKNYEDAILAFDELKTDNTGALFYSRVDLLDWLTEEAIQKYAALYPEDTDRVTKYYKILNLKNVVKQAEKARKEMDLMMDILQTGGVLHQIYCLSKFAEKMWDEFPDGYAAALNTAFEKFMQISTNFSDVEYYRNHRDLCNLGVCDAAEARNAILMFMDQEITRADTLSAWLKNSHSLFAEGYNELYSIDRETRALVDKHRLDKEQIIKCREAAGRSRALFMTVNYGDGPDSDYVITYMGFLDVLSYYFSYGIELIDAIQGDGKTTRGMLKYGTDIKYVAESLLKVTPRPALERGTNYGEMLKAMPRHLQSIPNTVIPKLKSAGMIR